MKSSEEKVNHTNNSSVQHQNSAFTVTVLLSTKVSTEVRWSMRGKTGNSRSFTERETLRKNGIVHFRSVFWFYAQGQLLCVCVYTSMCLCMRVRIVGQIICPIVLMLGQSEKEAVTWTCSQLVFFGLSSHQLCKQNTGVTCFWVEKREGKHWGVRLLEDTRSSSKRIPAYPTVLFLSFSCYSLYWERRHLM